MLVAKYSLFTTISTLANLLFQYLSLQVYSSIASLYIAMFFGTLARLVAKYIGAVIGLMIGYIIKYFLDKKYVFIHRREVIL